MSNKSAIILMLCFLLPFFVAGLLHARSMRGKTAAILLLCFAVPFIAGFCLFLLAIHKFNILAITPLSFLHLVVINTLIGGICGFCSLGVAVSALGVKRCLATFVWLGRFLLDVLVVLTPSI